MPRYLFVTGRLAARSLTEVLERIECDAEYDTAVLPISVAALMDTRFIAQHLDTATGFDRIIIPGACRGDLAVIADKLGIETVRGPKNLKDLPYYFKKSGGLEGYGSYQVKIVAEIVDANQMHLDQIVARAEYFRAGGADIIDLGCAVEESFPEIGNVVAALKSAGFSVSVDSFDPDDILRADRAGVDLVLSVNSRNIALARQLHCKVVVIPDFDQDLESLERNIGQLEASHVPYVIDPVLKPIGFGFAGSIGDYITVRRKYPDADMLMGVGNLTELTDADSTGITAVMAGMITELGINYALTTEVVSWTRGAVREFDLARKLMHYAHENQMLPKRLSDALITIKDPPFEHFSEKELRSMKSKIRDGNFRIFTDRNSVYVFNRNLFLKGTDIHSMFEQMDVKDASHAFYLGRELQKALLAVQLGKKYIQEEDLRWGYLSDPAEPRP